MNAILYLAVIIVAWVIAKLTIQAPTAELLTGSVAIGVAVDLLLYNIDTLLNKYFSKQMDLNSGYHVVSIISIAFGFTVFIIRIKANEPLGSSALFIWGTIAFIWIVFGIIALLFGKDEGAEGQ